jgi:hypothetical protein
MTERIEPRIEYEYERLGGEIAGLVTKLRAIRRMVKPGGYSIAISDHLFKAQNELVLAHSRCKDGMEDDR